MMPEKYQSTESLESGFAGLSVTTFNNDVFPKHSSSVFNELAVSTGGQKKKPVDDNVSSFEICPPTRYQFSRHYRNQSTDQNGFLVGNTGILEAEQSFNAAEIKRQRGRPVCYGQTIQFRHKFTHKFVQISKVYTSQLEPENGSVKLHHGDSIDGQFKILSKRKNRKEGDRVYVSERVIFESISRPSHYLHVSEEVFNAEYFAYNKNHELNMSPSQSTFFILRNAAPVIKDETQLKSGDVLRLFHNEFQGYLVAEGSYSSGVKENVHLRLRPLTRERKHSLQPSSSAITYWQVELTTSNIIDGYIKQSSLVRFLHMCTRQYLCIDYQNKVSLTDQQDKGTQFKLVSVDAGTDFVLLKSCYSLQSVQTGHWIHITKDIYKKMQKDDVGDKRHFESLKVSKAELLAVSSSEQASGEDFNEKQFDDLFIVEQVSHSDYLHCTFVAGMVPYLSKKHIATVQEEAFSRNILKCFEEMISFMAVDGKPVKAHQKLFRNLGIIDRLFEILNQTFQPENKHMTAVFTLVYDLLRAYVRGDSRKNKTHIARHMSLFFNHFSHNEDHVNQHAVDMVNEFTKNNMDVVEKITNDDMTKLVDFIRKEKEYRFLELMNNLCICQGRPVEDNQKYIANSWLKSETMNCLYFTKMGEELGKEERDEVFVTVDNARNWMSLLDLTKKPDNRTHCQFFYHQLETFERLCYGQNEHAIKVLRSDSKYNGEKQVVLCLTNTSLPDDLRSLYCQLFIALFVNTKEHQVLEERIEELYLYNRGVGYQQALKESFDVINPKDERKIKEFVETYIGQTDTQTSINVGKAKMTAQVLCLLNQLTCLGKFEIKDSTVRHLMNLLNGKTDQPERETKNDIQTFRDKERFKKSESTAVVVDTKIQCLMVFETYFNIVLKKRIKSLMMRFEKLNASSSVNGSMMDPTLALEDRQKFKNEAIGIIHDVVAETSKYASLDLPSILVDLTRYEYESLVTKTMETFYIYNTAIQRLLKHAQKVQIVTESSRERCRMAKEKISVIRQRMEGKISDTDLSEIITTLEEFSNYCLVNDDSEIPHSTLQNYLFSQGMLEAIFKLLTAKEIQDQDSQSLLSASFHLLERLTRNNEQIQIFVFNKLDTLLTMKGQLKHVFSVIKVVFIGNVELCKQITDEQIQIIIRYLTDDKNRHLVNTVFDILQAVILPDKFGKPVRRNQNLVMRHMTEIRFKISHVFGLSEQEMLSFIADPDPTKVTYFLSTVSLLATCSQDGSEENKMALQSTFEARFLLKAMTISGLSYTRLGPFLRCLAYGYLEGLTVDWLAKESAKLERLVKRLEKDSSSLLDSDIKVSDEILYQMEFKCSSDFTEQKTDTVAKLLYHFDSIVPFCQCLCTYIPSQDVSESIKTELRNVGVKIKEILGLLDCRELPTNLRSQFAESLKSLKEFTKWDANIDDVVHKLSSDPPPRTLSPYEEEQEINKQFQVFVQNLWLAAGVGYKSKEELWTVIRKRREDFASLEQNVETKALYEQFLRQVEKPGSPLELTAKIIMELKHTKSTKLHGELIFPKPYVHLGYMQTLRAIVLREIVKLPPSFELYLHKNRRQLRRVNIVQRTLIQYGAVECALQDLSPQLPNHHLKEALHLLICLLFHGNLEAQNTAFNFFLQRPDVLVISTLQSRIVCFRDFAMQIEQIKHGQIVEDPKTRPLAPFSAQEKTTKAFNPTDQPDAPDDLISNNNNDQIPLTTISTNEEQPSTNQSIQRGKNKVHPLPEPKIKHQNHMRQSGKMEVSIVERETIEVTSLILEFLTSICQNQHSQLQSYFREQFPIELSTNFIEVLVEVIDTVHTRINSTTVMIAVQAFDCLTQIVAGNTENKSVVLHTRVCEQTNFMLYMDAYGNCSLRQVYKLKKAAGSFWRAMTEETCVVITKSGDSTADLASTAIEYLDSEVILLVMKQAYQDQTGFSKRKLRSLVTSTGFQYGSLLQRKMFKFPLLSKDDILKTEEDVEVFDFYMESIRSVELLKDDAVHKVFFRVKDKSAFSVDIKEKIKYDVDRSSPVEKIKDFMKWSGDTIDYARNRWNLCRSPLGKLLVYSWLPVNYAMLILTISILIMISIDYHGGDETTTEVHELERKRQVRVAVYALGGIHNFLSLVIVVCFILLNRPQFHGLVHMFEVASCDWKFNNLYNQSTESTSDEKQKPDLYKKKSIVKRRKDDRQTDLEVMKTSSRLQVSAYGPKMIYYILFLSASICGTALHGLTFVFCLLQLFELNRYLRRIGRSVIYNAKYLGMLILIGLIILYIYAMIAFIFMRRKYVLQTNGHYCNSMPQCFVTILHHGLVGTTYNMFDHSSTPSFTSAVWIGIYNISFFVIITILGLYMVFAILIDGFLHLKQKMRRAKDDFRAVCFICGRSNADFSLETKDYEDHVKNDHNIWDYIYFFIHLDTTMASEYSALENFVHKQIKDGKYDFLPMNRAICLEERDKAKKKIQLSDGMTTDSADKGSDNQRKRLKRLPSFKEASKSKERKGGKGQREDTKPTSEGVNKRKLKPTDDRLVVPDSEDRAVRNRRPSDAGSSNKPKPQINERRQSEKAREPVETTAVTKVPRAESPSQKPDIISHPKTSEKKDESDKLKPQTVPADDFGDFFDDKPDLIEQEEQIDGFDPQDISNYQNRNEDPNLPQFLVEGSNQSSNLSLM